MKLRKCVLSSVYEYNIVYNTYFSMYCVYKSTVVLQIVLRKCISFTDVFKKRSFGERDKE